MSSVFLRSDHASTRKALHIAIGNVCGTPDSIERLIAIPSNGAGGWLWEVRFTDAHCVQELHSVQPLVVSSGDGPAKQVYPINDDRAPTTYRLSGLPPNTRYAEVLQAFSHHGHVLQFDYVDLDAENWARVKKNRVGRGKQPHVTVLPRTPEPLPDSLVLIVHDDTVQCTLVHRPPSRYESDNTDTDGNVLSDPCEYFSASAGEEPLAEATGPSMVVVPAPVVTEEPIEISSTSSCSNPTDLRAHATLEPPSEQMTLAEATERSERMAQALLAEEIAEKSASCKDHRRRKRRSTRPNRTSVVPPNALDARNPDGTGGAAQVEQLHARIRKLEATVGKLTESLTTAQSAATTSAAQFAERERVLEQKIALSGSRRKELEEQLRAERRRIGILQSNRTKLEGHCDHRDRATSAEPGRRIQADTEDDRTLSSAYSSVSLNSFDSQSTTSRWSLISVEPSDSSPSRLLSPPVWNGHGSPYLLQLLYAAHVIQPHLVAGLNAACKPTHQPLLVGACAWLAHVAVPMGKNDTSPELVVIAFTQRL